MSKNVESLRGMKVEGGNIALCALLGVSSLVVAIWPDRTVAVLLGLGAIAFSPAAHQLFSGLPEAHLPNTQGLVAKVKSQIVVEVGDLLEPVMSRALPTAMVATFKDDRFTPEMISMMAKMMQNPEFRKVIKDFSGTAMHDPEFMGLIKEAVQEALSDSNMYKSAMHGVTDTLKDAISSPFHLGGSGGSK
eukprot:TRINITY_DN50028_c0_g1_i1.p1 TRINITY_DN50028_c0_g1~~TRINITY_DN50028_c0_g1_i1.p1  ORF type:complete len:190 (-),score=41.30 TRINITY_DN50028_c0_g1_i1:339-908(-)